MRTKLRDARRNAGYTQDDLADAIGISRSYYGQIESGVKNPSYRVVLALKMALHDTDDAIFEDCEGTPTPGNPYIREYGRLTLQERAVTDSV